MTNFRKNKELDKKIKVLTNVLGISLYIPFLVGFLGIGIPYAILIGLGFISIVTGTWLMVVVNKNY
jgi:hypothetical protein